MRVFSIKDNIKEVSRQLTIMLSLEVLRYHYTHCSNIIAKYYYAIKYWLNVLQQQQK